MPDQTENSPAISETRGVIVTSLNLKRGPGKTMSSWLAAGGCQERGKRCLVVDLDKQANISTTLLGDEYEGLGAEEFFDPSRNVEPSNLVRQTAFDHIDVIPASFDIERFNVTNPDLWEPALLNSLVDPLRVVAAGYDYVLLDCPADISLVTVAAMCASDFLLIPFEAAQWGCKGTQHVIETMTYVRDNYNSRLQLLGYLINRFKKARGQQRAHLDEAKVAHGEALFDTVIPDDADLEKSVNEATPVHILSPSSRGTKISRQFFDEFEARVEKHLRLRRAVRQAGAGRQVQAAARSV